MAFAGTVALGARVPGSVTNVASATDSFNNRPIISPQTVAIVRYKQQTNDIAHNGEPDKGNYGGAVVPVVPVQMMYSSPMYSNEPYGYSSEPYGTTETPNSDSNAHKAKAHLSKHKHKNHSKHHKTGKNHLEQRN